MNRAAQRFALSFVSCTLLSCAGPAATAPADGNAQPPAASGAPTPSQAASSTARPTAPESSATIATSASAAPPPSASAAAEAPAPAPAAAVASPLPDVKVVNIGMHIGGGPNDPPTKEPIKRSVEPHFDAFRRCFAMLEDQTQGGDIGVDLRIERGGGKAAVSHPRTALKGKPFEACVVQTFEAIEFLPPKGGTTTVSYSLRFTPGKVAGGGRKGPKAPER
jgi:hypothetical protein